MLDLLQSLGQWALALVAKLGRASLFFWRLLVSQPPLLLRPALVIAQLYSVGTRSLTIIVVSGGFVGMVLALQGYYTLVDFGAEQALGTVVALSLVRELGPVVTALLFAGRAGSALSAEHWEQCKDGGPLKWRVENGYMEVVKGTGQIRTRQEFGDIQLHVEWAAPFHCTV